jgi:hypothetical protein
MASKADFTEQEWETMQRGVTGAGMFASFADQDLTDSFGEAKALAQHLAQEHKKSESALVRDLTKTHGTGFGMGAKADEIERETLAALRDAIATLEVKAPDEVNAYRELVLGTSITVAAAKHGVQDAESRAIDKIRDALMPPKGDVLSDQPW